MSALKGSCISGFQVSFFSCVVATVTLHLICFHALSFVGTCSNDDYYYYSSAGRSYKTCVMHKVEFPQWFFFLCISCELSAAC